MTSLRDECSICLEKFSSPVKLECNHYFCHACIRQHLQNDTSKRICPLCNRPISTTFKLEDNIVSMNTSRLSSTNPTTSRLVTNDYEEEDDFWWYYEGNKGWWKFDPAISKRIEQEYQKSKVGSFVCAIKGHEYTINLRHMNQARRDDPSKKRKIKRDSSDVICKGIAGLRI